jgi:hypothetical protein
MICEACDKIEATAHVTLSVTVLADKGGPKTNVVQFWLCPECLTANRQVMARGPDMRKRLARRLTEWPEYLSRWQRWAGQQRGVQA